MIGKRWTVQTDVVNEPDALAATMKQPGINIKRLQSVECNIDVLHLTADFFKYDDYVQFCKDHSGEQDTDKALELMNKEYATVTYTEGAIS